MSTPLRLPTGTVTFLFTDIEGSTRLWEAHPETMRDALATHDAIFRELVPRHNGVIFKTVGDAICAAFERPDDAVRSAVESQRRLTAQAWPEDIGAIRVRMGIHTGMAQERDDDYFGPAVNRVARFMSIAHGGQILVSGSTHALLRHTQTGVALRELGEHHLKDLNEPEAAYQVVADGLATAFPGLTSLKSHPNNLPASISSFVGRTNEMRELRHAANQHRLISIVGPGGIGKTRLALRLAEDAVENFRDGAWIVELAPVSDPELVAQTVADAFHLREQPQTVIDDQLVDHLAKKKLLIVFDNTEHLLAATARLAKKLLTHCPDLAIVTTSREPLHLAGEHVYRLASLALEGDGMSEAVQLFVERARRNQPELATGSEAAIDRICRRLDGVPLAIELAAARTGALSLDDIERRLADRLQLLVSRDATQDDRQRTLRGAIDWSYQLLTPEERRFARALSVFEGGFTGAAAMHVGDVTNADDLIESLAYKSLIVAGPPASDRHALLEMIGEYLRQALIAEGEADAANARHFTHFYDLAAAGMRDGAPDARAIWTEALEADIANVRVALTWALRYQIAELTRFIIALTPFWQNGWHLAEGEGWCRHALELSELGDTDRAPLLRRASTFATMRSNHHEAYRLIVAARDAYQRLGDRSGIAETTYNIAVIEHRLGLERAAEEHYVEAFAGFEVANHLVGKVRSLMNLVLLALQRGDVDAAQSYFDRSNAAAADSVDADLHSDLVALQATVLRKRGRHDEAIALYRSILVEKRAIGNRYAVADNLVCMATALVECGEIGAAIAALREVFEIEAEANSSHLAIYVFEGAAEILVRLSLFERAAEAHSRAARLRSHYQY